ncbi:histidine phosphatase family protein [Rhodoferax sp. TBRC 17198]|uniref:histidine phosphatase family protein n=1 Tax=Rhodoferax potami TaxID=3068338 RepID=UPI0028BD2D76|nr:histidine phosphatase family protein [Rhodoferax sp. TBRC 17198]MDT7523397.1 histidine phosphatase family protein [Rhodoferax sp. TBRC 17198]
MKNLQHWFRGLLFVFLAWSAAFAAGAVNASGAGAELKPGSVVLIRHALAPGVGDPAQFVLNDCSTQRNLNDEGRAQAVRIGKFFRQLPVPVEAVWSSQWCRTRETADLAFPGQRVDQAAFNSFFGEPDAAPAQTQAARALLNAWAGKGLLVVVTHQVNITAITGVVPASGEAVVLGRRNGVWAVTGRLTP